MVALVDNQVTVAGHTIIDDGLFDQTLNHRDIQ